MKLAIVTYKGNCLALRVIHRNHQTYLSGIISIILITMILCYLIKNSKLR